MNVWNEIPNALTLLRLLLCPVVIALFLRGHQLLALAVFAVACLTDFLDGFLARRWNAQSELGSILDPVCDKLFAVSFFALLLTEGHCPSWFFALFVAVTLLQSLGFLVLRLIRGEEMGRVRPLRLAKWSTTIQFVWIGWLFAGVLWGNVTPVFHLSSLARDAGYAVVALLQTAVFFRYSLRHRRWVLPDVRLLLKN